MLAEEIFKYLVIITVLLITINTLGKIFAGIKHFLNLKYKEYKHYLNIKKCAKQKLEKQKNSIPNIYFGLFQFDFENCDSEEDVKKEYCCAIKEKMKSKYSNSDVHINATDKIFFHSRDFSKLDMLVDDLIKLYNFFENINKKRNIKTNLKFAMWAKPNNVSIKQAYKILNEINNLDYTNQVIVNDVIYNQYKYQGFKMFDFEPRGIVKLIENDEDFELYRLLKSSVAKPDNK